MPHSTAPAQQAPHACSSSTKSLCDSAAFRAAAHRQLAPRPEDFDGLVFKIARRFARRSGDLDDLTQEGKIAVFRGLGTFVPEGKTRNGRALSLTNYLGFRIRHAMKEFSRSHYRPGFVSLDAEIGGEDGATLHDTIGVAPPSEDVRQRETRTAASLAALTDRQREASLLCMQEYSGPEIGDRMGISHQAAYRLIDRARRHVERGQEVAS